MDNLWVILGPPVSIPALVGTGRGLYTPPPIPPGILLESYYSW